MYVSHGHIDLIMTLSLDTGDEVEVGIIMRFMVQRGWAWTRSLLGPCAQEIHICGEASAIDLVKELMLDTGDEVLNSFTRSIALASPHICISWEHRPNNDLVQSQPL
jgi:hypothetical protein